MNAQPPDDLDRLLGLAERVDDIPPFDPARFEVLVQAAVASDAEGDPDLLPHEADDAPFGEVGDAGWWSQRDDTAALGDEPPAHLGGHADDAPGPDADLEEHHGHTEHPDDGDAPWTGDL